MPTTTTSFERVSVDKGDYSSTANYRNFDSVRGSDGQVYTLKVSDSLNTTRVDPTTTNSVWVLSAASLASSFDATAVYLYTTADAGAITTIAIGSEGQKLGINSSGEIGAVDAPSIRHLDEYAKPQDNRYSYYSGAYAYFNSLAEYVYIFELSFTDTDTEIVDITTDVNTNPNAWASDCEVVLWPDGEDQITANSYTVPARDMYESNGLQMYVSNNDIGYGSSRIQNIDNSSRFGLGSDAYSDYNKIRRNFEHAHAFVSFYNVSINSSSEITNPNSVKIRKIIGMPLPCLHTGTFFDQDSFDDLLNFNSQAMLIQQSTDSNLDGQLYVTGNVANGLINNTLYTATDDIALSWYAYTGVNGLVDFFYGGNMRCGYGLSSTGSVTYIGANISGEAGNSMDSGGITDGSHDITGTDFNNIVSIASIGNWDDTDTPDATNSWCGTFFAKNDGSVFRLGVLPSGNETTRNDSLVNTPTVIAVGASTDLVTELHSNMGGGTGSFVVARTANNKLFLLGDSPDGEFLAASSFTEITVPSGKTISKVKAGYEYFVVIMTDGTVWFLGAKTDRNDVAGTETADDIFVRTTSTTLTTNGLEQVIDLPDSITDVNFYMHNYDADNSILNYRIVFFGMNGKPYYCDSTHKKVRAKLL